MLNFNNTVTAQVVGGCDFDPFSPTILTVSNFGDEILWTGVQSPSGDVFIEGGTVLRITGTVIMCRDARVIVKRGAKLIIDGGEIRGSNAFLGPFSLPIRASWAGIEVRGNSALSHPSLGAITSGNYPANLTDHGVVWMHNNGIIEDAANGITTKRREYNPVSDTWTTSITGWTGGIIIAQNATFLNNRRSVEFLSYAPNNISVFDNCTFDFNSGIEHQFKAYVTMWDVHDVTFENQTLFIYNGNGNVSAYAAQYEGPIGIYSINADYTVENNAFIDLQRGIHTQNTMVTSGDLILEDNVFEEDGLGGGILLQGTENVSILNNAFILDDLTQNGTYNYGLFLDQCDGYRVEGNNADNGGIANPLANVGILVNLTGNSANEIYRNGHGGFAITNGIITQQQNTQLQIRCNDLEEVVEYNIAGLGAPFTMSQLQGDCSSGIPAGNTFNSTASPNRNIFIEQPIAQAVRYRHHSNDPYVPHFRTGPQSVVINEDCLEDSNSSTCPNRTIEDPCATFPFCRVQEITNYNQSITQLEINKTQETPGSPEYIALENQIAYVSLQRDLVYNQMIREGMQLNQLAAVMAELEQLNSHRVVEMKLIPLYLAVKDYTKTNQALTNFTPQNNDETLFKNYYSTLYDIHSTGREYAQMTTQEENTVRSIAATLTNPLARKAQNILTFAFNEHYPETYLPLPNNSSKQAAIQPNVPLAIVFPNPSNERLTIRLSATMEWQQPQIVLFDIHGRKLKTYTISDATEDFFILTSELPAGVYWINVLDKDIVQAQQKIVIAH